MVRQMMMKMIGIMVLIAVLAQPVLVLAEETMTYTVDEALAASTYFISGENEIKLDVQGALEKNPNISEGTLEQAQLYLQNLSDQQVDNILIDNELEPEEVKLDTELAYANFGNIFFVIVDAIADGLYKVAEFLIIDDVRTLFDPNASGYDKALAAAGFFPFGKVIKGGKLILKFTNKSGRVVERVVKNTPDQVKVADQAIDKGNKIGKPVVLYNPKFAAQQLLKNGKIELAKLEMMVPNGAANGFRPSATIADGFKYNYTINGTKIEIKWHAPDAKAAAKYPGSNSGSVWTAQIKIGNELLGQDGKFYAKPGNITHIPVEGIKK